MAHMAEAETWRPLGVDTEEEIAEYDALHDGVPAWMSTAFWEWVRRSLTIYSAYADGSGRFEWLDVELAERMCQELKIPLPSVRSDHRSPGEGARLLETAMLQLTRHHSALQVADYILAHTARARGADLDAILERSKSAWTVGTRAGKPALVRRVPVGVQVAADSVMARAGRAGVRLAKAWEELYGVTPNPSEAYRQAILAVEDASVPVVSPKNASASLGTVLRDIENQKNWKLPMEREHPNASSGDVLVGVMRMLWHGQHDRHGGQPSAPGDVSMDEATVAVSLAVTLVHWFDAALPRRGS